MDFKQVSGPVAREVAAVATAALLVLAQTGAISACDRVEIPLDSCGDLGPLAEIYKAVAVSGTSGTTDYLEITNTNSGQEFTVNLWKPLYEIEEIERPDS